MNYYSLELEASHTRGCRCRGLITLSQANKEHHVKTIARVAGMLGEDED